MRHDKLKRELNLLLLLTENTNYTVLDLCEKLGVSQRNLYYYLDFLRDAGFTLIKSGYYYRLDRGTKFFKRLREGIDFTENEAVLMRRLLDNVDNNNPIAARIKTKFDRFYDLKIMNDAVYRRQAAHNVEVLCEAIKMKYVVVLKDYSSPHGNSMRDRYVEPFMMMNDNNDVRGYEMSSEMNKTFKVSRMSDVQIINAVWGNEAEHRQVFTDRHTVSMILGQLSYNILREEYPRADDYLTKRDDDKWLLTLDVCSYLGIGRFVMGLYEDIEIVGNDEFVAYIRGKISSIYNDLNRS